MRTVNRKRWLSPERLVDTALYLRAWYAHARQTTVQMTTTTNAYTPTYTHTPTQTDSREQQANMQKHSCVHEKM